MSTQLEGEQSRKFPPGFFKLLSIRTAVIRIPSVDNVKTAPTGTEELSAPPFK